MRYTLIALLFLFTLPLCSNAESVEAWKFLHTDSAVSIKEGWQTTQNGQSITGSQMRIGNKTFQQGLGTHAPGEIVFDLQGKHKTFRTFIGVDRAAPAAGSVVFQIFLDGKKSFDSGIIRHGNEAVVVRLNVQGVKELKLVCADAGDGVQGDHANWAEAAVDDEVVMTPKPAPLYSTAGFYPVPGSPRTVYSFNPGWRFYKGDVAGAEKPDFDDSQWEGVNVPHGLELLGSNLSGGRNYQGPAWYRKVFELPNEMQGKNIALYFEAAMGKTQVFLDGKRVAEHFGGYLPFAVDLSGKVVPGQKHVIAVRTDNSDDPNYPPGREQYHLDFTYLGGIYRDVYLIATNPVHVSLPELSPTIAGGGVFVGVLKAGENKAEFEVRTEVIGNKNVAVRTAIENAEMKEIAVQTDKLELSANSSRKTSHKVFRLNDVRCWHPDDPYQHWIRTDILDESGNVLDSLRTRFGMRLFEMRGRDGFFVNGQFIGHKLSGVNRHQDYAVVGNALPNSGQWRDVKLLREGGSTVIRAAHYPLDPAFMDACDEYGMLIAVATPGWQFYNEKNPLFWQRCVQDTRKMARRDRNRPAVLLWETGLNETLNQPIDMLKEMHAALHEEIPMPGVFSCTDVDHAKAAGMDVYYHGGMNEEKCSFTREYGDGGQVENFYSQNASTRVKREWGEQALFTQAMLRYKDLSGIFNTPPLRIGATLWCGIDHQRGYHPDPFWGGLLDEFRIPKYSYHVFKSQYDADFKLQGIETGPMVQITHELTQVSPKDVLVITNCEEVRLTWLGQEIGTRKPESRYEVPHPPVLFPNVFDFGVITSKWRNRTDEIEMIAEGIINGKVVCTHKKRYPQRSVRIQLHADDLGIGTTADGADFFPVRATVVDKFGTPKVLASEYITFVVDGEGTLMGEQTQYLNPVKTEFGTATALVRTTKKSGLVRVRAFSEGLIPSQELIISMAASPLPLLYHEEYATSSQQKSDVPTILIKQAAEEPSDMESLRKEIEQLKVEAVSREQELMELRSRRE